MPLRLFVVPLLLLLGCAAPRRSPEWRRAPEWRTVRDAHVQANPRCAVCGRTPVEVHHIAPFSTDPQLELCLTNLMSLCRHDHFLFGHLCDWSSVNTNLAKDALYWRVRIEGRPD